MLSSCHGNGDEPSRSLVSAPVVVAVAIDTTMAMAPDFDSDSRASDAGPKVLRLQLRAYAEPSSGRVAATPSGAVTTYFAPGDSLGCECRMVLPSGRYRLEAWADYVVQGTETDLYYNTESLNDIFINKPYTGGTDWRNAYSGNSVVDFRVYEGDNDTIINAALTTRSVMAKVKFVAIDYNEWAKKPQNLRVLVSYPQFMPSHFSVARGVPFDATTGISFITGMSEISTAGTGRATLGSDYVMVNGESSSVSMAIGLYDDGGHQAGRSGTINVPIRRGALTVVTGKFLTTTAGDGGIGIDPDFEGEINIYY